MSLVELDARPDKLWLVAAARAYIHASNELYKIEERKQRN